MMPGMVPSPRLLAVGHVTFDRREGGHLLGGSVSYAALAARRLGWQAGVLTAAGPDFAPERDLPAVSVFLQRGAATTRFENAYGPGGERGQVLLSRAPDLEPLPLPAEWQAPDALLLGPVAGELPGSWAPSFEAGVVGAIAQGWVREFDPEDGRVSAGPWRDPRQALFGVHVLFLSEHDLPEAETRARELLELVPMVALTRGWRGLTLLTRGGAWEVAAWPRPEVDPTGAGDVFAAAFLVRYHECDDPLEAAAFAACAASCVVEGPGLSTLGDRAEVERRLVLRERLVEDGEWEE